MGTKNVFQFHVTFAQNLTILSKNRKKTWVNSALWHH